ncbi:MAG: hypothetical protein HXY50_09390 [Ignavibacteriaceae bacterium]|nr:hypothetical protein [Ignavibacteriaceae bacterium]
MTSIKILLTIFISLGFLNLSFGQTQDTVWRVPELDAFHDIIYPIWHTAYPAKDYDALKKMVDEINTKAKNLYSASLPGIQRDKQLKWNEGIINFQQAVEDYNKFAVANENENLLKAAENLHSKYEILVRIVRPVLKEMDEFHKTLYVVYHDYLPNKNYKKLSKVTDLLIKKAKAITKAKLSSRLEPKKEAFNKAAAELLTSTQDLKKRVKANNKISINAAVENMHTKYQNLEGIFE